MVIRLEPLLKMIPYDLLIVDDSTAIRKILQRVLHSAEIPLRNVYEAGDGLEAIAILKANKVSLILSDINMPNMDGLQLLTQIRANDAWKSLPVIMITTEGSQVKVIEAAQLGANGYVRKPFTPEQIKNTLATLA
jgi:two-component system chemotaxis response regulator CheY